MRQIMTFCLLLVLILHVPTYVASQSKDMTYDERKQVNSALDQISKDVLRYYYDPKLHGVDWDTKVQQAREKIKEEKSLNLAMAHVAAVLDSLNDSHTFLIPPRRPYILDHGWAVQMIGDKCYVTRVRPGGDADKHGVKPGDQLIAINGYRVGRDNLWKIEYAFNILRPQPQLTVTLRNTQGEDHKVLLEAEFRNNKYMGNPYEMGEWYEEYYSIADSRIRTVEYGSDLLIVKMPSFLFDENAANKVTSMVRKHKSVILDVRENPGGNVAMLSAMVGDLFDHDVKISDRVARDNTKPIVAKTHHHNYDGKVIVVIDSKSASASELLARVMQLEKRGSVVGDRSSGNAMEAKLYSYIVGTMYGSTAYGASITDASLIMSDGRSLEHEGVTPDEVLLPNPADLANGRDPVLSHAAELAGVKLSPDEAGKLFPYDWPKEH